MKPIMTEEQFEDCMGAILSEWAEKEQSDTVAISNVSKAWAAYHEFDQQAMDELLKDGLID